MKSIPNQEQEPKEPNDIKIGMSSRTKNIVRYCNGILKEKTATFLKLSAIGQAITMLVDSVEILKLVNPGLYQSNKISTVSFQSTDEDHNVVNQKMYPKFEVILSFEPREKNEGFQDKIPEEERKKMFEMFNDRPMRSDGRGYGYGRQDFDGRERSRGGFNGRGRGGFGGRGRGRGYGYGGRERDQGYGYGYGGRGRGRGFGGRGRGFGGRRDDYEEHNTRDYYEPRERRGGFMNDRGRNDFRRGNRGRGNFKEEERY